MLTDRTWEQTVAEIEALLGGGRFTRAEAAALLAMVMSQVLRGDVEQREESLTRVVTLIRRLWADADARDAKAPVM